MPVARREIKGFKYWVIERRFRGPNGEETFRRVAQVQSKPAAEAEERRVCDYWNEHGTIKPLLTIIKSEPEAGRTKKTWDDAVVQFSEFTLPKEKPSSRRGDEAWIDRRRQPPRRGDPPS